MEFLTNNKEEGLKILLNPIRYESGHFISHLLTYSYSVIIANSLSTIEKFHTEREKIFFLQEQQKGSKESCMKRLKMSCYCIL